MPQDILNKYRRLSHITYDCRYHVVWITKYRFNVINDDVKLALKWSIKHTCDNKDIEIIKGAVGEEYVHLYLNVPLFHTGGLDSDSQVLAKETSPELGSAHTSIGIAGMF